MQKLRQEVEELFLPRFKKVPYAKRLKSHFQVQRMIKREEEQRLGRMVFINGAEPARAGRLFVDDVEVGTVTDFKMGDTP